jgi:hypothetical protein
LVAKHSQDRSYSTRIRSMLPLGNLQGELLLRKTTCLYYIQLMGLSLQVFSNHGCCTNRGIVSA